MTLQIATHRDLAFWPKSEKRISRSYLYKDFTPGQFPVWLQILVQDEAHGSRVWAASTLGD